MGKAQRVTGDRERERERRVNYKDALLIVALAQLAAAGAKRARCTSP